jgi:hypothetical protein
MSVYKAIAAITAELAGTGISKDRRNQTQGYAFRGIDDVYGALSRLLAKHGLCIIPRVVSREQVERQTAKGGTLFYTTVAVEYDLISAEDGSKHTATITGEAMDSADKSTNKAMSAAYKYLALQLFCIPTEGDNDADASHHEVATTARKPASQEPVDTARADALALYSQLLVVDKELANEIAGKAKQTGDYKTACNLFAVALKSKTQGGDDVSP